MESKNSINYILNDYARKNNFNFNKIEFVYSRFAADLVYRDYWTDSNSEQFINSCWVDGPQDLGIDAVVITVNEVAVMEINDLFRELGQREQNFTHSIKVCFLQSKFKSSFHISEFTNFMSGVEMFLTGEKAPVQMSTKLSKWFGLWKSIRMLKKLGVLNAEIEIEATICFNGERFENGCIQDRMILAQQNIPRCCSQIDCVRHRVVLTEELISSYTEKNMKSVSFVVRRKTNGTVIRFSKKTARPMLKAGVCREQKRGNF